MSPTKLDPINERERLRTEQRNAYSALDTAKARHSQLDAEYDRRRKVAVDARAVLARGHDDDAAEEVAKTEARLAELDGEIDRCEREIEGAAQAQRAVELELRQLMRDRLTEFAEVAEAKTVAAAEAWEALRGPYEAAYAAHGAAAAEWAPLRDALTDGLKRAEDEQGVWRSPAANAEAVKVPEWPLDEPGEAFAEQVTARPTAIRLVNDQDD